MFWNFTLHRVGVGKNVSSINPLNTIIMRKYKDFPVVEYDDLYETQLDYFLEEEPDYLLDYLF